VLAMTPRPVSSAAQAQSSTNSRSRTAWNLGVKKPREAEKLSRHPHGQSAKGPTRNRIGRGGWRHANEWRSEICTGEQDWRGHELLEARVSTHQAGREQPSSLSNDAIQATPANTTPRKPGSLNSPKPQGAGIREPGAGMFPRIHLGGRRKRRE